MADLELATDTDDLLKLLLRLTATAYYSLFQDIPSTLATLTTLTLLLLLLLASYPLVNKHRP